MSEKEESIRIEFVEDSLDCQIARILCPEATYGDTIHIGKKRYEAMKALIEKRERAAWEAARRPEKHVPVFGNPGIMPVGRKYQTFDDWKKEQEK